MPALYKLIGWLIFPLIRGSSTVECRGGQAAWKRYHPRPLVRLLNFIAFGTFTHLYETKAGLILALERRRLLGLVLKAYDLPVEVSPALRVESLADGSYALVTRWVEGDLARPQEIEAVQRQLEEWLGRLGLPLWSISHRNPRAHTNFIRRKRDGVLVIIDFEALLLGPLINDWVDLEKLERELRTKRIFDGKLANLIPDLRSYQVLVQRRLRWNLSLNRLIGL